MGCRNDYMVSTKLEDELDKVISLNKEFEGNSNFKDSYSKGYKEEVYNNASQKRLDYETDKLCKKISKLSFEEISKYSKEMQKWWIDHKDHDKEREIISLKIKDKLDNILSNLCNIFSFNIILDKVEVRVKSTENGYIIDSLDYDEVIGICENGELDIYYPNLL